MARLCERPTCGADATFAYGFDVERRIVWLDALGDERFRAGGLCREHADRLTVPRGWWLEDRRTPESLFEVEEAVGPAAEPQSAPPKPRRRRKAAAPEAAAADAVTEETPGGEPAGDAPEGLADDAAGVPAPGRAEAAAGAPAEAVGEGPAEAVGEGPAEDIGDDEVAGPIDPILDPTVVDLAEPFEEPDAGEPDHQWEPAFASVDPDPAVDAATTPMLAKAFGRDLPPQPRPRRRSRRPRPDATSASPDEPPTASPPAGGELD